MVWIMYPRSPIPIRRWCGLNRLRSVSSWPVQLARFFAATIHQKGYNGLLFPEFRAVEIHRDGPAVMHRDPAPGYLQNVETVQANMDPVRLEAGFCSTGLNPT